jgi:hypothetical protein
VLTRYEFEHGRMTYSCKRGMTPPPIGHEKADIPRMVYWDVRRSDGASRRFWVPVGREFTAAELEAATLEEFGVAP